MRAIFMGTPAFALPVLKALLDSPLQVVAVYTAPDRPSGRGLTASASPIKQFALQRGLPVLQPPSLRKPDAQEQFAALTPDVAVVAAYGLLVPPALLSMLPHGFLNIHPSLLPKLRGPSPVVTAILEGLDITGVTLMLLDQGLDTGPILAQRETPIAPDDTAGSLTLRLFDEGASLLLQTLPLWAGRRLTPVPQDPSMATHTRKIEKEDGQASWAMSADELHRRLRAFTPWPGLYTTWQGKTLKILQAQPLLDEPRDNPPGSVVSHPSTGKGIAVVTGKGLLKIITLQLEGKRPASAEDFLRGYPALIGSRLPS
jgi:methionyl-tRNA formyltransferase